MADLGILLTDDLAQAAFDGRKTVTRRPMVRGCEAQPSPGYSWADCLCREIDPCDTPCEVCNSRFGFAVIRGAGTAEVGGRVWVREAFLMGRTSVQQVCGEHVGHWTTIGAPILYRADGHKPHRVSDEYGAAFYCVRPSIHMPKWAARTWGRIVSVRPCDLSGIDDVEAQREGFDTAAECVAAIRAIYPDARWFWRVEWSPIDRPEVPRG